MRSIISGVLGAAVIVAMSGCGGKEAEQAAPEAVEERPALSLDQLVMPEEPEVVAPEEAAPAEAPVSEVPAEPAVTEAEESAAAAPDATDPQHALLIGTTWTLGDMELNFKDASTLTISGGPVAMLAPDGLDAAYTYAAGALEVSAVGQTRTGTWDGSALTFDGQTAERKQQ